jgi:hypothetical protein
LGTRAIERTQIGITATADRELVYLGPSLDTGRIDLRVLSDAIGGFAALTERSSSILYGQSYEHKAELAAPFERGSIIVPLEIVSQGIHLAEHGVQIAEGLLLSPSIQALANLCTLLGVGATGVAFGLFKMFKTKKGRLIDPVADAPLLRPVEINIELNRYIRLYNDNDVRSSIRRTLRPLREDGITEFQTRMNGVVIERVTKEDLMAADEAELNEIEEVEERWLDIQKVALVRHLAWHFAGDGATFDAKITDDNLWKKVEEGDRFGAGDRLKVILHTTASRDRNGRLHVEHVITEVLEIEHHRRPVQKSFDDDPRIN